jgi:hypothetical protein
MFENAFDRFYVDENELKKIIYNAIECLTIFRPEEYSKDLLDLANPDNTAESILYELMIRIPQIGEFREVFADCEPIERLRFTAIKLENLANFEYFDDLALKIIYRTFDHLFILNRYNLAVEFINKELGWTLNSDPDLIMQALMTSYSENPDMTTRYSAVRAALAEIDRLYKDEEIAKIFHGLLIKYESEIENYIKNSLPGLFGFYFYRLAVEAPLKSIKVIEKYSGFDSNPLKEMRELLDEMLKVERKIRSTRLEITQGGKRKTNKFQWSPERSLDFYKTVEKLPKIKNKSAWQFAVEELIEADFDDETIRWVKSRPALSNVPERLFNEAVNKWRKYDEVSEISNDKDKPQFFEFRHALHLLDFPDEFAFGTLRNRYFEGKKICENQ